MNQRRIAQLGVIIMTALLVLYFVFAVERAVALLRSGTLVAILMGVALLILPLLGVWALVRELKFGRDATKLVDELDRAGLVPMEEIDTLPSGSPVKGEAQRVFPPYQEAVERDKESWQAWARLGIMYDACGERSKGRKAVRTAILLKRNSDKATERG